MLTLKGEMEQERIKLFEILLWNYAHNFKESWTKFFQNVEQKKKFVTMLEKRNSFKILPDNYFILKKIPANGRKQALYWEKAFEFAGIPNDKIVILVGIVVLISTHWSFHEKRKSSPNLF